jgi:hypothetical protein
MANREWLERLAALIRAEVLEEVWEAAGGVKQPEPPSAESTIALVRQLYIVASSVKNPLGVLKAHQYRGEGLEEAAHVVLNHQLPKGTEGCDVRDELAAAIRALK